MEQAKETIADVSNKIAHPIETVTNTAEMARSFSKTPNGTVVVLSVIGVVVLFFFVIVIYWMLNRTVNNRKGYTIPQTKMPVVTSNVQTFAADMVPPPGNGKRMSFTFWMYIYDLEKFKGLYRNVFYRGDSSGVNSSPEVLLDPFTNKLHIIFGSESADPYDGNEAKLSTEKNKYLYKIATRGITLDYIPLQRWVHIAIVVNEEVNGGTITGYIDGEMVKMVKSASTSLSKNAVLSGPQNITIKKDDTNGADVITALRIQNMNLDKRGNIFVGGNSGTSRPGFSGLVSKITFYNYDINARDVFNVYKKGPADSLAAKIGYDIQSPIYRLG